MADAVLMEAARDMAPRAPALAPVLAAVGGLAVTQSVVSGIAFVGLPAIIREAGLSLDRIGLVYLLYLPWVLKFLWAPAVERCRLPPDGRLPTGGIVATGTAVGGTASGALAARLGYPACFGLAAVIALAAVPATARLVRHAPR
ncbi:hypothetical protein VQ03_18070 [Methylobacterium tarhaniae]|uniref:MFS transporter n=1 Tax=Methylobacterium tarhaniae TaxID=1187852 RepID=A0A0J6SX05_9HYPH|nr:hypothetical protein [Methylobacterium tarhaniae]KMO38082.1 hypothetical protein VQ03_18070 [Methylobacterium tarhaniae]